MGFKLEIDTKYFGENLDLNVTTFQYDVRFKTPCDDPEYLDVEQVRELIAYLKEWLND